MSRAKLVVVGDSLSQGFMGGAVFRTDISYPVLIARALGGERGFTYPQFTEAGGLPLNLEGMLRQLTNRFGSRVGLLQLLPAVCTALDFLGKIENYWDHTGRYLPVLQPMEFHNQSVWGFKVDDGDMVTEGIARRFLSQHPSTTYSFFRNSQIPFYITASRVLNPTLSLHRGNYTQVDNVVNIANQQGIENLIFWLGANNALGTVTSLTIRQSTADDINKLPHETDANLYRPEHFERAYRRVSNKLDYARANRVFVGTIPHVTIAPVVRGVSFNKVNPAPDGYYEYYTRPWIWDDEFNPRRDPHLTRQQAKLIDSYIDQYNQIIREVAVEKGWYVVDTAKLLSDIAYRRTKGQARVDLPLGLKQALARNPLTSYLIGEDGRVKLDTRYLRIQPSPNPIVKGGLFSLDGVHPTTIGYGLIADQFLKCMREAGVRLRGDLPWDYIVSSDSLVVNPPTIMEGLRELFRLYRFIRVDRENVFEMSITAKGKKTR